MSVATLSSSASYRFAIPPEPILPLTVAPYHAMICAGTWESDAPVELHEGWRVTKMPKNPAHSVSTSKTRRHLCGTAWYSKQCRLRPFHCLEYQAVPHFRTSAAFRQRTFT